MFKFLSDILAATVLLDLLNEFGFEMCSAAFISETLAEYLNRF